MPHCAGALAVLLTFAAGLLQGGWFLRRGALLPVIVAHTLGAAAVLGITSDSGWLRLLAVGGRYLGWGGKNTCERIPSPTAADPGRLRLRCGDPENRLRRPGYALDFCTPRLAGAAQDQPRDGSRFIHRF
ncbi:MAG: hypothetical protein ACYCOY_08305 [Metallibacterium sp.]